MENMGAKIMAKATFYLANSSTYSANGNFYSVRVRPHRTNPRNTMLKAISWLLPVIIPALLLPPGAQAAYRPFALRYTANSTGGILLIGNNANAGGEHIIADVTVLRGERCRSAVSNYSFYRFPMRG